MSTNRLWKRKTARACTLSLVLLLAVIQAGVVPVSAGPTKGEDGSLTKGLESNGEKGSLSGSDQDNGVSPHPSGSRAVSTINREQRSIQEKARDETFECPLGWVSCHHTSRAGNTSIEHEAASQGNAVPSAALDGLEEKKAKEEASPQVMGGERMDPESNSLNPALVADRVEVCEKKSSDSTSRGSSNTLVTGGRPSLPSRRGDGDLGMFGKRKRQATAAARNQPPLPQLTTFVTLASATKSTLDFGDQSKLDTDLSSSSVLPRASKEAPLYPRADGYDNVGGDQTAPDIGWLDCIVGGVPFKDGDLAASVVWLLVTFAMIPLLLIRLLRRSSLISMVLATVMIYMVLNVAGFGIRAWLSNNVPTTTLMIIEDAILGNLLPLLIEPLLHLLSLFSVQSGRKSGVPTAVLILRILNLVAFILFAVSSGYNGKWLWDWQRALDQTWTTEEEVQAFPPNSPPEIVRIGPILACVVEVVVILGAGLLVPVARGETGSMRPGTFLLVLLILLLVSTTYRSIQSLHASQNLDSRPGGEQAGDSILSDLFFPQEGGTGQNVVPEGMYNPYQPGIDWSQLQTSRTSRSNPQSPLLLNLVYILPQWLMVLLLFFAHSPAKPESKPTESEDQA
ncbi:hypothetical protein IE53DRAFT_390519 [Violaceomyces palustris]|uniref:Uncharacterized protein n=1 Tax=Violaceomyces palustris TaxID=1673888 RepID=A0ACD0NNI1_9BASI|nr:hypothetical protein IE53DRAFT_390519 [Violaceomyces palustris]